MPATPHRARRPTNTRGSVHACSRYDLAHFHAYYQDAVPVFSVESAECIAGALPRPQQRLVMAWVEIHRQELLDDWALLQSGRAPFKIEPLR